MVEYDDLVSTIEYLDPNIICEIVFYTTYWSVNLIKKFNPYFSDFCESLYGDKWVLSEPYKAFISYFINGLERVNSCYISALTTTSNAQQVYIYLSIAGESFIASKILKEYILHMSLSDILSYTDYDQTDFAISALHGLLRPKDIVIYNHRSHNMIGRHKEPLKIIGDELILVNNLDEFRDDVNPIFRGKTGWIDHNILGILSEF